MSFIQKIGLILILSITAFYLVACKQQYGSDEPSHAKDAFFEEMNKTESAEVQYQDTKKADVSVAKLFYEGEGINEIEAEVNNDGNATGRQDYVYKLLDENGDVLYHIQYYSDEWGIDELPVLIVKDPNGDNAEVRYYNITNKDLVRILLQYVD